MYKAISFAVDKEFTFTPAVVAYLVAGFDFHRQSGVECSAFTDYGVFGFSSDQPTAITVVHLFVVAAFTDDHSSTARFGCAGSKAFFEPAVAIADCDDYA